MSGISEQELKLAFEAVKEHYVGKELTEKRVLAAHLRAVGLSPNGEAWLNARTAYEAGSSFEDAASFALEGGWAPTKPYVVHPKAVDRNKKLSAQATRPTNMAPDSHVEGVTQTGVPSVASQEISVPEKPIAASKLFVTPPLRPAVRKEVEMLGGRMSLEWFPKVCGPGDLIGEGARKLLGQPKVAPVALLVRETAQNSWDARIANDLEFTMSLRKLSPEQLDTLRSRVLTGRPDGLGLKNTFEKDEVWVLEISDRGSKGLGGPVRPDTPVHPGEPMDFVNMVFNIGAPSDRRLGGGTYGFGKAVGYLTSACGTTLVWSHAKSSDSTDVVEARLIGSAIGDGWEDQDHRYTGRHWWGVVDSEGRIGPVLGKDADEVASTVFESSFGEGDTGTSIMIIDPVLGGPDREADAQMLSEAVLWNLWPKMVPTKDGTVPMNIKVLLNGKSMEIPDPQDHPLLEAYTECLIAVRGSVSGIKTDVPLGEVCEIWQQRPRRLLGHLAMKRFASFGTAPTTSDIDPLRGSSHHVCLMRHAELVVTYDEQRELDDAGYHWAAVFQPTEETDASFSAAEPPAHDEWIPNSITDRDQKSAVTVALRNIREKCSSFAAPKMEQVDSIDDAGESVPVIYLANSLSGLVASSGEDAPRPPGRKKHGRRSKSAEPNLEVQIDSYHLSGIEAHDRIAAEVGLMPICAGPGPFIIRAAISAIDENKAKHMIDDRISLQWSSEMPINTVENDRFAVSFSRSMPITLKVIYPDDVTLDMDFSISELS